MTTHRWPATRVPPCLSRSAMLLYAAAGLLAAAAGATRDPALLAAAQLALYPAILLTALRRRSPGTARTAFPAGSPAAADEAGVFEAVLSRLWTMDEKAWAEVTAAAARRDAGAPAGRMRRRRAFLQAAAAEKGPAPSSAGERLAALDGLLDAIAAAAAPIRLPVEGVDATRELLSAMIVRRALPPAVWRETVEPFRGVLSPELLRHGPASGV